MSDEIKREDLERVTERVQKLLNLAAKNPNQQEAAAATAKAMEMLEAYNLDLASFDQGGSEDGKREDARQRGGMYTYERELWRGIAEINFCMYFVVRKFNYEKRTKLGNARITFQHRFVGRKVNVVATKVMGEYLQGAIERLCRERFPANNQFFCREAVAYREGMADAVMDKLQDRRRSQLQEERRAAKEAEKRQAEAAAAGVSTSTAITLSSVIKSEEAANYDFIHGDGAWARNQEWEANWRKNRVEQRKRQAEAEAQAEAEYARWAAENPEEAAKEEKKRLARERKAAEKEARRQPRYRSMSDSERRQSSSYFYEGRTKGSDISLDQQADTGRARRAIR